MARTDPDLERVWRDEAPHALAALVRRYGDFDTAEDAVQEALLAAATQWPQEGLPRDPRAWLIRVAARRLVDQWRAQSTRAAREERVVREDVAELAAGSDDSLALLLLCCHPSLSRPSQVALTLRAVGGLSTTQVARGFLVPKATMAQRISRAKARLRETETPFAVPTARELPARVDAVLQVLYLVFTEGHTSTSGGDLIEVSLADEAIRLTRELHRLLPGVEEVTGLLALMLLTDARRAARIALDGSLVPLAEQDRAQWDRAMISEGVALVEKVLPVGPVGPYQLQAAIAAVHAESARAEDTDWRQIATIYGMLADLVPGPMVTLNQAVAVGHVEGPEAALAMLEPLEQTLARHHRLHAVRAHLLDDAGRPDEARTAYRRAAGLATSIPEQRYLIERGRP